MRFALQRRFIMIALCITLFTMAGGIVAQEATPEPTAEATAEPTVELLPLEFVVPDGIDLTQMVAVVGDETITLGDYVTRMRYEWVRYYQAFQSLVEVESPAVFNLQAPDNQYANAIINVVNLLADTNQFPAEIYEVMVLESLYRQEAIARNIEFTECELNTNWSGILQIQITEECVFPEDFEAQKAEYTAFVIRVSGISPELLEQIVIGRVAYAKVQEVIAEEFVAEDQPAIRTRHIRIRELEGAEGAEAAFARINNGEDFMTVLAETTVDTNSVGNRGSLGMLRAGQTVAEFDAAIFNNPVGLLAQPIQTQFGFHVIRVDEIGAVSELVQLRQILLASENEANVAIRLLNEGEDFGDLVTRFSLDAVTKRSAGLMNPMERATIVSQFNEAVAEAVFSADDGQLLAPIETARGWHVIQVVSKTSQTTEASASHILVETLEEATAILERINNGEDFSDLAYELSIDPSARGFEGDTLAIFTDGQASGLYISGETREEFDAVLFADGVAVGDILGPVQTRIGFYILEVVEIGTRAYTATQIESLKNETITTWQTDQETSERVVKTQAWRTYIPTDPLPSDVFPDLVQLNLLLQDARANIRAFEESTNIINTLRTLQADDSR
ncbi:MAG: peptidylprolyl isomerase [Phototrophicales bacterium]|nr:peptidylprolyl isomerase [Phototrophicales bacterium]